MFVNIKISKEGNKISPASNIQQGIASVRRLTGLNFLDVVAGKRQVCF